MNFIMTEKKNYPISLLCRVMKVSRSAFYAFARRVMSRRDRQNQKLSREILLIHTDSRGTYGRPRIHAELTARNMPCGHERVRRLMKLHGIGGKQKRKFKVTTQSQHHLPVAKNILARQFAVDAANCVWVADITAIPTAEGWLYLAAVLDLYSRRIVGYSMDGQMNQELVIQALKAAIDQRQPPAGIIHHSDRGSQYASHACQKMLSAYGMICSMSNKGDCFDNAVMESFFHTLKVELVHHRRYKTRNQARAEIFDYIEVFYNRRRRHSYLGYATPVEFERLSPSFPTV